MWREGFDCDYVISGQDRVTILHAPIGRENEVAVHGFFVHDRQYDASAIVCVYRAADFGGDGAAVMLEDQQPKAGRLRAEVVAGDERLIDVFGLRVVRGIW